MTDEAWFTWGVPAVALLFGAFAYGIAWLSAWDFDRRYGRDPK